MDGVEISPITAEDIIYLESSFPDWGARQKHNQRWQRQKQGEVVYLIARQNGKPVGHVLLKWQGASEPQVVAQRHTACPDVEDLFVLAAWRNQGIGAQLMRTAEELVRAQGVGQIGLSVGVENSGARRLYARLGYQDAGFGEHTERGIYLDADEKPQVWEECCVYLIKRYSNP
jgi:GNAT superfamily N-acetyltransferase